MSIIMSMKATGVAETTHFLVLLLLDTFPQQRKIMQTMIMTQPVWEVVKVIPLME